MNLENITIQDCIDKYEKKGEMIIVNDGKVKGFIKYRKRRKSLQPTANQSRDR